MLTNYLVLTQVWGKLLRGPSLQKQAPQKCAGLSFVALTNMKAQTKERAPDGDKKRVRQKGDVSLGMA